MTNTPETSQLSGPEPQNNLFQIVANAGSSELSIGTASISVNVLENFDPVQDCV